MKISDTGIFFSFLFTCLIFLIIIYIINSKLSNKSYRKNITLLIVQTFYFCLKEVRYFRNIYFSLVKFALFSFKKKKKS